MSLEIEGFLAISESLRSGVYLLAHKGVIVYIGKSKTMLNRIYAHRSLWGKKKPEWLSIRGILFDEVFIRPCPVDLLDELEFEMINLYKPKLNQRLKSPRGHDRPSKLIVNGRTLTVHPAPEPFERRA
jgi:excinuclease UvrABC nuclease subunit